MSGLGNCSRKFSRQSRARRTRSGESSAARAGAPASLVGAGWLNEHRFSLIEGCLDIADCPCQCF